MKFLSKKPKIRAVLFVVLIATTLAEPFYQYAKWQNEKEIGPEVVSELYLYAKRHGMREDVAVIVDFSVSSRFNRFYVVDLNTGKVLFKSKCAHGKGGGSTVSMPVFSNSPGSNCSSLGHYKIYEANRMHTWKGVPCLRLRGLDATNSNAEARGIVIHGGIDFWQYCLRYWQIPLGKISEGCFAINFPDFFRLRSIFKESDKQMLLYAIC